MSTKSGWRPPRDNLVRAIKPGIELRASKDGENGMPTLSGHFAVFDTWTEVNSAFEGHFLERIAPGSFTKTFKEQRDQIKVLFQHGHDPVIGDKPLGKLTRLEEDKTGAFYEAPLFDTSYNRDLLPGLEAGVYGASFRFRVLKEEVVDDPEPSDYNPRGLPERTIQEAQVYEGGPVTFGQYPEATAGVRARSLTDEMFVCSLRENPDTPGVEEIVKGWIEQHPDEARTILESLAEREDAPDEDAEDVTAEGDEPDAAGDDASDALPEGAAPEHSEDGSRDATTSKEGRKWSFATHGKEWRLP